MTCFAFLELSGPSIVMLLIIGVVLFGRQLPDVGYWLGKTVKSVQDGVKGIDSDAGVSAPPRRDPSELETPRPPQRIGTTAPKFEDRPPAETPPAPPVPPV